MTVKYCDRVFLKVNGQVVSDIQSCTLKQNKNAKVVPSMTPNGRNRGFVQGNLDIDITAELAELNGTSRPKFESINYESNSVAIVFQIGSDPAAPSSIFTATGVFQKDATDTASGVGSEVKATFNWGALDLLDASGNPVSFDISTFTP
jgi:hypothetical protein